MSWYYYPKPARPRKPKTSVRSRTRGKFGQTWWAKKFLDALNAYGWESRLARGRSYARNGQVATLETKGSKITAAVQGSQRTPYRISVTFRSIGKKEWRKVIDGMTEQAIFTAKLLAGEMPADIEAVFARCKTSLFPRSEKDIAMDCSCPDWAEPCKHIAAAFYLLGERFDQDPFVMFALRGMAKETLLAMLRKARGVGRAPQEKKIWTNARREETHLPPPLETQLAQFYQLSPELKNMSFDFSMPLVSLPLLKRIPPPSYAPGREKWLEAMALFYDDVSKMILKDARSGGVA